MVSIPARRKAYPSDVTDAQWELLAPFIPEVSPLATVPTVERREIVNGILYVLRIGCSWRQMPHDLPACKTVYHYFRLWNKIGIWDQAMHALRKQTRRSLDREEEPSAAIIDSQSIITSPVRDIERGYDGGKKRHAPEGTAKHERAYTETEEARPEDDPQRFYGCQREKKAVPRCHVNRQLLLIRASTQRKISSSWHLSDLFHQQLFQYHQWRCYHGGALSTLLWD